MSPVTTILGEDWFQIIINPVSANSHQKYFANTP